LKFVATRATGHGVADDEGLTFELEEGDVLADPEAGREVGAGGGVFEWAGGVARRGPDRRGRLDSGG
jgi:hypothetical protein